MKVIKIIIGVFAALFAAAHVVALIYALAFGSINFNSPFAASAIGGRVFGILIGTIVAIVCFRPKKAA